LPHKWLLLLALLYTLLNALKPLTIDDTAYHSYAAQAARAPLDPYGFAMYWWGYPEPASEVLAPPLLGYWWAVALRLFGDNPFLCKMWLLPFAALFAYALYTLSRRFARGLELPLVALTLFSPTFLPSLNLMLDVPALALGLAAVALFARACDRNSFVLAGLAGLLAGAGMETKYTAVLAPAAMLLYAVCLGRLRLWPAAAVAAAQVFLSWEFLMALLYGESHFLRHARPEREPRDLLWPLVSNLGSLAWPLALLALAGLGARWRGLLIAGAAGLLAYAGVACCGGDLQLNEKLFGPFAKPPEPLPFAQVVFGTLGAAGILAGALAVGRLARLPVLWRWADRLDRAAEDGALPFLRALSVPRGYRVLAFLLLWLGLEVVGYVVLTPFPAVRRVLGVVVVATVLFGRLAALTGRSAAARRAVWGVAAYGAGLGLLVYGVDLAEARAEKGAAEEAVRRIRAEDDSGAIWYVGHWGFQYYAERAGMRAIVVYDPPGDSPIPIPPRSAFKKGDWLVLPEFRYGGGRFAAGVHQQNFTPDDQRTEVRTDLNVVMDDRIPLKTIMTFYSGCTAVEYHDGPRLQVEVRRVLEDHDATYRR
jgi:hypothetical protein